MYASYATPKQVRRPKSKNYSSHQWYTFSLGKWRKIKRNELNKVNLKNDSTKSVKLVVENVAGIIFIRVKCQILLIKLLKSIIKLTKIVIKLLKSIAYNLNIRSIM